MGNEHDMICMVKGAFRFGKRGQFTKIFTMVIIWRKIKSPFFHPLHPDFLVRNITIP
jgi:hypothetical protein